MELKTFFDNFETMAEAPNGVQKMREMILQLAVQGKLVPQDPNDVPASVLVEKIKTEKEKLINVGEIKSHKPLPPVRAGETFYRLPQGWVWARLREVAHDLGQKKPEKEFTYIDVTSINKEVGVISNNVKIIEANDAPSRARKIVKKGSVIYSTVRPYLLNIAIVDIAFKPEPIASTAFAVLHPFSGISNRFLYHYLRSKTFIQYVENAMTGMAYPAINDAKMNIALVPVPPANEQHRIVAKVDELMALCDDLEARKQETRQTCIKLNDACIDKMLTAREPARFNKHWKRIHTNFDLLYSRPENVTKLRQAILQLAVQGKLVPQDPNDEPASVLLEKIQNEKRRMVKNGSLEKPMFLQKITTDKNFYDQPTGWVLSHLGAIALLIQIGPFGSLLHRSDYIADGTPLINPMHIRNGRISPSSDLSVDDDTKNRLKRYMVEKGDVIMARRGEMGRCAVVSEDEDGFLCGTGSLFIRTTSHVFEHYLTKVLTCRETKDYLSGSSVGSTMNNLNQRVLNNLLVPLPPLNEQHRIVAKVDQLMALCDDLEIKLQKSQKRNDRLMEAAVAEMLAA